MIERRSIGIESETVFVSGRPRQPGDRLTLTVSHASTIGLSSMALHRSLFEMERRSAIIGLASRRADNTARHRKRIRARQLATVRDAHAAGLRARVAWSDAPHARLRRAADDAADLPVFLRDALAAMYAPAPT